MQNKFKINDPSDNRNFIYRLIESYEPFDADEQKTKEEMLDFIVSHVRCFENDEIDGHITGSALLIDSDFESTLLTHHVRLNKWLQFGGHSDGGANTIDVALRETMEESGLKGVSFTPEMQGIFALDIHPIPADRTVDKKHLHYDIRILLTVDKKRTVYYLSRV